MRVDVKVAQCALQLTNDERVLIDMRRQLNRRLTDVRRQRLALVESVVALDKKAPSRNRGRRRTGHGVSTNRNIAHSDAARKVKNFIDLKSAELARGWTSWREEDAR